MNKVEAFSEVFSKLSAQAPDNFEVDGRTFSNDKKAVMLQITLNNGAMMSGAMSATSIPGVYALRTVMRRGDPRTGAPDIVDQFVWADDIHGFIVPVNSKASSGLVGASGKEIVSASSNL